MLSLLASIVLDQTLTIEPSDDVWVYVHAQDQSSDPYLRAWGTEGDSVGPGASFSVLKFDLSTLPEGQIISAKLVLTSPGEIGYIKEDSEKSPIQVRIAPSKFEEENFSFATADSVRPASGEGSIFGSTAVTPSADQKDFKVEINLMPKSSKFLTSVSEVTKTPNKLIGLALTSVLDPAQAGEGGIYKFYSRNNSDETKRPKLVFQFKS